MLLTSYPSVLTTFCSSSHRKKPRAQTSGNIHWNSSNHNTSNHHGTHHSNHHGAYQNQTELHLSSNGSVEMKKSDSGRPRSARYSKSHSNHSNKSKSHHSRHKKPRSHTTATYPPSLAPSLPSRGHGGAISSGSSRYDILPNANLPRILHELLGYNPLDLDSSVAVNDYFRTQTASVLNYRYQSLSLSQRKQFKPPLNDPFRELRYFRNIAYPSYELDTNEKIRQIITQNIYDNQTPYLRIRIPLTLSKDVFGNNNLKDRKQQNKLGKLLGPNFSRTQHDVDMDTVDEKEEEINQQERESNETFNIELSPDDILNTTVQEFFHSVVKQISSIRDDKEIERLFLGQRPSSPLSCFMLKGNHQHFERDGHHHDVNREPVALEEDHSNNDSISIGSPFSVTSLSDSEMSSQGRGDWSRIAIKAKGLEEYS